MTAYFGSLHLPGNTTNSLFGNDGYTSVMEQTTHVDLMESSFDEFVPFLFDRSIPPRPAKRDLWYWHVEVECAAKKICAYYVQLFQQPEFLLTRFTKPQLEEGFWAVQGPNLDCSASRIIDDSTYRFPSEKGAFVLCSVCLNVFSPRSHSIRQVLRDE